MADPAAELVEVVDAEGRVERVVTRAEVRAHRLRHRCTYVAVIDGAGRLVVHRRADWKDVWPGRWDLAFGGLVGVGEDWATAAARELAEEAGVSARLAEVAAGAYDDDEVAVLGRVYLARHDGPFTFADGEVVEDDRVPVADVPAWLEGRAVCPDSVALVAPVVAALAAARPTVTRVQAPWEDR